MFVNQVFNQLPCEYGNAPFLGRIYPHSSQFFSETTRLWQLWTQLLMIFLTALCSEIADVNLMLIERLDLHGCTRHWMFFFVFRFWLRFEPGKPMLHKAPNFFLWLLTRKISTDFPTSYVSILWEPSFQLFSNEGSVGHVLCCFSIIYL